MPQAEHVHFVLFISTTVYFVCIAVSFAVYHRRLLAHGLGPHMVHCHTVHLPLGALLSC